MDYTQLAADDVITRTMAALKGRKIETFVVNNRAEALVKLNELIPEGAEVFTGSSTTLDEMGYTQYLKGSTRYKYLNALIAAEGDANKRRELRRQTALAQYYVGSVHAIAESGEVVVASRTGSQLAAYVFGAQNILWIAGVQKVTHTLEDAIRRVREHTLPLEDARMKRAGASGSVIGKLTIFEDEVQGDRIKLLLVKEKLGF